LLHFAYVENLAKFGSGVMPQWTRQVQKTKRGHPRGSKVVLLDSATM